MPELLRQVAELLADAFLRLAPRGHQSYHFPRGNKVVIVTVEAVRQEAIEEYKLATAVMGWKIQDEAVNVS